MEHKIIKTTLVLILLGLSLFVVSQLFGLPFGNFIAKNAIQKYLAAQYPQQKFRLEKIIYNPKNSDYRARILDDDTAVFSEIKYYWQDNSILDTKLNQALDNSFDTILNQKV